jgi:hypothetical protein
MEELWIDDVIDFTTKAGWQKGMALFEAEHKASRVKSAQRTLMLDVGSADLASKDIEFYCQSCNSNLIGQRKKKAPDAGTPNDVDRDALPLAAQRLTKGGLYEPAEDDRQPTDPITPYRTKGGLMTPDMPTNVKDELRALFFERPPAPHRKISEDERQYRSTYGGLLTPND